MGRELKRKDARKNKNTTNKKIEELDTSIKISTLIKIVIGACLILLVLYYVVAVFITKEIAITNSTENTTDTTNTTEEVSNKILASKIFDQKEEKYYVYFYDFTDDDDTIASVVNNSSLTIYHVNTNDALNKNYVTEENSNKNVTSISDLKVKNPTILEITNDKVTAYYEGFKEIMAFFN